MFLCNDTFTIDIIAIGHVWHLLKQLPSLQWRKGFYPEYLRSISLLLWKLKDKYHPFSFVALNPNGVGFHLGEQDSSPHLLLLSSTPWKHIPICINFYLNIHAHKSYCNYPFYIWQQNYSTDDTDWGFWLTIQHDHINLAPRTHLSMILNQQGHRMQHHLLPIFPWIDSATACHLMLGPSSSCILYNTKLSQFLAC